MKKILKIFLVFVLVIVVILATVSIWQWDNLSALITGLTTDEIEIEKKIEENKQKLVEINKEEKIFDEKIIEGFSKEDEEKIAKGEITAEEAVDNLFSEEETNVANNQETNVSSEQNPEVEVKPQPEVQPVDEKQAKQKELLENAVKEMYIIKATFTKRLAELEREGKKMYIADNATNMTMEHKLEIADYLMPQFVQAEKDCDAKVDAILTNLADGLKEIDADTSVVQTIRDQYNEEKKLKKAQYIKEYL